MTISRKYSGRPAVVVFVHQTECYWLRALKPGFRHCFVAIEHGPAWLICDSLKTRMELILLDSPGGFSLGTFYADQGHHVLAGRTALPGRRTSVALAPLTCVTIAKRLLGVRAPWVWTPWQLFCHLVEAQPCRWRRVSANAPAASLTPSVIGSLTKQANRNINVLYSAQTRRSGPSAAPAGPSDRKAECFDG